MSFETRIKSVVWTEAEVATVIAGAVIGGQFVDDRKIWKEKFQQHPEWFEGPRANAPFMIKWSGALKAGAALYACSYVTNPWLKLFLMGIAFQGTLQQARIITWDKHQNVDRIHKIGDSSAAALDDKLRSMAEQYRATHGPEYINLPDPEQSRRYETSVALPDPQQSERYTTAVAGVFDEDDFSPRSFSFKDSDPTAAY